jgi:signal transduction histidine kinase/CheY-like chemotaxis protein
MQALGRWNTMRVSRMLSFQSDRISAEQLRADKEGHRSLMFARVGFAIFCGLAMILLRERWQLRKANQRLEKEIENADQQRQAKERMEIRLAQTERLESLGALAGGVAHDFNNLLVGVIGNADLLRHIENVTPQGMKCLDGIIRSAETAAGLSRKMLAYAGKQPATKRTVDLNESISRMLPLLKAGLGNRHRISFFASPGPLLTEGDSEQLDQILLNLVSNSAQAMVMEKGAITIQTGSAIYDSIPVDVPTFGNRKTGGHFVWFEVADNGQGIGESDLARVFEPFFSTREKSPGHGFGLAVVYGHVNRHDGLIQVMSSRGNGSRFRVLLPQSTKTHHSSVERVSPGNPSALSPGLRVVAIDDQSAVLEVLERVIATVGGKTVIFTSATDAMEYLSETIDVDCVLLDLQMPILDGPSVLDEMSIKGIRVPVVLMSGFSPENPDDLSRHPRVKAILQKPFRPEDVISAISMAIVDHGANSVNSSVCLTADRTTRASV